MILFNRVRSFFCCYPFSPSPLIFCPSFLSLYAKTSSIECWKFIHLFVILFFFYTQTINFSLVYENSYVWTFSLIAYEFPGSPLLLVQSGLFLWQFVLWLAQKQRSPPPLLLPRPRQQSFHLFKTKNKTNKKTFITLKILILNRLILFFLSSLPFFKANIVDFSFFWGGG